MSKRNLKVYLIDIAESIQQIELYLDGINEGDFYEDDEKQDAVLRRLEIIGEAVKQIPHSIRDKYQQIPWRNIAGMRDIIIHQYFGVSLNRVWITIQKDLPELKATILTIIQKDY